MSCASFSKRNSSVPGSTGRARQHRDGFAGVDDVRPECPRPGGATRGKARAPRKSRRLSAVTSTTLMLNGHRAAPVPVWECSKLKRNENWMCRSVPPAVPVT